MNNFIKLIITLLISISLFACGGSSGSNTVKIGVLNTDSGELASFGSNIRSALKIAETEINQKLNSAKAGFRISFEFADTATNPETALSKLTGLHQKGINIFIGPMSSSEANAVLGYSTKNGIILVSPASTATSLAQNDFFLRTVANDIGQAYAITSALKYFNTRFYAPIWRADPYGDDLTLIVGETFERQGGLFAPGSRYQSGTTDFTQALNQLDEQVDAYQDGFGRSSVSVYAVAFDEIWQILEQANSHPILSSVRWYGSDGVALNEIAVNTPVVAEFLRKSQLLSPIFAGDHDNPEYLRVRELINQDAGFIVRPYAVLAYDAALLITEALKLTGTLNTDASLLKDKILEVSQTTNGASGNLTLDQNGDRVSGDYEFWQVRQNPEGQDIWVLAAAFETAGDDFANGRFSPR